MARKNQLVCQHLENVSRDALEKHQNIIRRYVRHRQGVYALYRRNKLYYVGLASSLQGRLKMHLRDRHANSWDRFSVYLTIGHSHLKELESLILRVVRPKGNKQKGKFVKSEDLYRKLDHDSCEFQRAERMDLFGKVPRVITKRKVSKTEIGRVPVLAKFTSARMKLRAFYKGRRLVARVRRDGSIRFEGKRYTSPSDAGAAAVKRQSCNGWTLWEYERAPGDWVKLNELRK